MKRIALLLAFCFSVANMEAQTKPAPVKHPVVWTQQQLADSIIAYSNAQVQYELYHTPSVYGSGVSVTKAPPTADEYVKSFGQVPIPPPAWTGLETRTYTLSTLNLGVMASSPSKPDFTLTMSQVTTGR